MGMSGSLTAAQSQYLSQLTQQSQRHDNSQYSSKSTHIINTSYFSTQNLPFAQHNLLKMEFSPHFIFAESFKKVFLRRNHDVCSWRLVFQDLIVTIVYLSLNIQLLYIASIDLAVASATAGPRFDS